MNSQASAHPQPPKRWGLLIDEIRSDHIHGASWLARRAAEILAKCAREESAWVSKARNANTPGWKDKITNESMGDLAALAWALVWARPSMAAIANTVSAIWRRANPTTTGEIEHLERLRTEAERLCKSWDSVVTDLELHILPLLHDPIFTISRSGSVEHTLITAARARSATTPLEVIIAESRPGSEGVELAQSLSNAGARVTLVTDSAIGIGMARARTLILGADSVRSDGALINKVGSYPAALVASDRGIPVYALCERLKVTPATYPLVLEHAPSDASERKDSEENWLFDVTPTRLITAIITEQGALSRDEIAQLAADAEDAQKMLRDYVEMVNGRGAGLAHPE
jgi:translation initiation factor 2B subunit (eIF-2B alpha/beta/delta family)